MSQSERCSAHKYFRTKTLKGFILKCKICPHYISAKLAIGRKAQCPYCSNTFKIEKSSLNLVNPHCGCRNTVKNNQTSGRRVVKKKEEEPEAISGFLDDLVRKL